MASLGNLMIGAERLNTFPPRSSTKWLCVATKAKAMERGVRKLMRKKPIPFPPWFAQVLDVFATEVHDDRHRQFAHRPKESMYLMDP